jgi:hypothetical protein
VTRGIGLWRVRGAETGSDVSDKEGVLVLLINVLQACDALLS